jgi:hypothetical protein
MIAEIDTDSSGTVDFDGEFCLALFDFVVFYGFGFYPARRTKFWFKVLQIIAKFC